MSFYYGIFMGGDPHKLHPQALLELRKIMTSTPTSRPTVLCILDGWGERAEKTDNAIALANTPTWDRLHRDCPTTRLDASADKVGLPAGQMGNSEVGHMNIGAGRIIYPLQIFTIETIIFDSEN